MPKPRWALRWAVVSRLRQALCKLGNAELVEASLVAVENQASVVAENQASVEYPPAHPAAKRGPPPPPPRHRELPKHLQSLPGLEVAVLLKCCQCSALLMLPRAERRPLVKTIISRGCLSVYEMAHTAT